MSQKLIISTVNVNGIRAAYKKGMEDWLAQTQATVVALQEVRASDEDISKLIDTSWHIAHDPCIIKGRAGVALISKQKPVEIRKGLGDLIPEDTSGRWLEADYIINNKVITIISAYVHSGEVGTPKQESKWRFLDAMIVRMRELHARAHPTIILGDLNVGHTNLDIKNWKGNLKKSGFLPEERAYFDQFFGKKEAKITTITGEEKLGLGYTDVGRKWAGELPGPYSWWSRRGNAFDTDTGWRIDYQIVNEYLANEIVDYQVEKAASYEACWSDHAPVTASYNI